MANKSGLRLIGWAYGVVVVVVGLIALVVVTSNLNMAVEAHPEPTRLSAR